MNITRRRGAITFFVILGICLVGLAVLLNVGWIIVNVNTRRIAALVLGIIFFMVLIAGLILNTIFLVREIRRNERQDSFLNAVTHELKTPIASSCAQAAAPSSRCASRSRRYQATLRRAAEISSVSRDAWRASWAP